MEYKYLCRQITNQCIIAMAKVGYIFNSEQYDTFTFDRAWMEKYGCCRIIEDSASQEKTRPEWKQLMDCLKRGDELVISKFSKCAAWRSGIGDVPGVLQGEGDKDNIHSG